MSTLIFTPYAKKSAETELIYLLAFFLSRSRGGLIQLVCNGAFHVCGRDRAHGWQRELFSCTGCIGEQRAYGSRAGIDYYNVTSFLSAEEIAQSQRFVMSISRDRLTSATFEGQPLFKLCLSAFEDRFGRTTPHFLNRQHEIFLREMFLSAVRMFIAARQLVSSFRIHNFMIPAGQDFLSSMLRGVLDRAKIDTYVFKWKPSSKTFLVAGGSLQEALEVEPPPDIPQLLRQPVAEWSPATVRLVEEIALGLSLS